MYTYLVYVYLYLTIYVYSNVLFACVELVKRIMSWEVYFGKNYYTQINLT